MELRLPPIPVDQWFAELDDRLAALAAFLPALAQGSVPDNMYRGIFRGILLETRDGYANAVDARKHNDLRRLAWATRTLVELKIWTKHVIASEENAKSLQREFAVDSANLWKLLLPTLDAGAGRELFDQLFPLPVAELTSKMQEQLAAEGLTGDEQYTHLSAIAKPLGLAMEYKYVNAILSKFVHATGLSILGAPELGQSLLPIVGVGVYMNVKQILDDIQGHLPKVGLPTY